MTVAAIGIAMTVRVLPPLRLAKAYLQPATRLWLYVPTRNCYLQPAVLEDRVFFDQANRGNGVSRECPWRAANKALVFFQLPSATTVTGLQLAATTKSPPGLLVRQRGP